MCVAPALTTTLDPSTPGATEAAPLTVQLSYSRARVGARARVHGARTHGGARAQRPLPPRAQDAGICRLS
jgi:hypothetical protein